MYFCIITINLPFVLFLLWLLLHVFWGGFHGVRVTVIENGLEDTSSNPGQGCLHFT